MVTIPVGMRHVWHIYYSMGVTCATVVYSGSIHIPGTRQISEMHFKPSCIYCMYNVRGIVIVIHTFDNEPDFIIMGILLIVRSVYIPSGYYLLMKEVFIYYGTMYR